MFAVLFFFCSMEAVEALEGTAVSPVSCPSLVYCWSIG